MLLLKFHPRMFWREKRENIRNFHVLKWRITFVKAIDRFLINVVIYKVLAPASFYVLLFVQSIGNLLCTASLWLMLAKSSTLKCKTNKQTNKRLEVSHLQGPFQILQIHSHLLSTDSDNGDCHSSQSTSRHSASYQLLFLLSRLMIFLPLHLYLCSPQFPDLSPGYLSQEASPD